jgi:hypothetical protein
MIIAQAPATHSAGHRLMTRKAARTLLITLGLLLLFGFKDILLLLNQDWPHLYAVVGTPVLSWEESTIYLPLANHFSLSTPLPAAPMADPTLSQFTYFPPLTLIVPGVFLQWLFLGNRNTRAISAATCRRTAPGSS